MHHLAGVFARICQPNHIGYSSGGVTFSSTGGKIAGAGTFDGVNGHIKIMDDPDFVPGNDSFSIAAWIRTSQTVEGTILFKQKCASVGEELWHLGMWGDGRFYYRLGDGDELILATYNGQVYNDDQWYHVAATFDRNGSGILYVDGVEKTSASLATLDSIDDPSKHDIIIGAVNSGCGSIVPWDGQIDDVRYYDHALTAAEIAEIYNAGAAGLAAQDCTNPNGAKGAIIYNLNENAPQYCDGANWVKLGGR